MFTCTRCSKEVPDLERKKKSAHCRACRADYSRAWLGSRPGYTRRCTQRYRDKNPDQNRFSHTKSLAKKRGITFQLTLEDFVTATSGVYCPICVREYTVGTGAPDETSKTIDRLDSSLPYTPQNCACICHDCNSKKNSATPAEHRRIADWTETEINRRNNACID